MGRYTYDVRGFFVLALVACSDTSSRKTDPTPPLEKPLLAAQFKEDCSANHAPAPERDPNPMCLVPAATFVMGTPIDAHSDIDGPARKVTISKSFYIDQLEVTNEQFSKFLNSSPQACGSDQQFCLGGVE